MDSTPFYRTRMKTEFGRIQKRNPSFSLRAYAGKLGLHPGTLSSILNEKRSLPQGKAVDIADRLGLTGLERKFFLESARTRVLIHDTEKVTPSAAEMLHLQLHSDIIAEWEHSAILSLLDLDGAKPTPASMARRLTLSLARVRTVLRNLERAGLIKKSGSGYQKVSANAATYDDIPSTALKEAHRQELELARQKLETVDVRDRFYSSMTVAVSPENLPRAKELARRFMMELGDLLERGQRKDVYQICLQMFPLTEKTK